MCMKNISIYFSVDHTRVKLKDVDPNIPGADYINANYINTFKVNDNLKNCHLSYFKIKELLHIIFIIAAGSGRGFLHRNHS